MIKKLLSIILSIMMIVTVTQVDVHAETSIEGFDFDILLDNLYRYVDWSYEDFKIEMRGNIIDLESTKPQYNAEFRLHDTVIEFIPLAQGGIEEERIRREKSYSLSITIYCRENYSFDEDSIYYKNNISPTPSEVDTYSEKNHITIHYTYIECLLDNSGGGSGDTGDSVTAFNFGDYFLRENLNTYYGYTYSTYTNILEPYIRDVVLLDPGVLEYAVAMLPADESIADEIITRNVPYYIRLKIEKNEGYVFKDSTYYKNNIYPSPSRVELSSDGNYMYIFYSYNSDGDLETGGGSGDVIDEIDLSDAIPDFSEYKNKTIEALVTDIYASDFGDFHLYNYGVHCKRVIRNDQGIFYEYTELSDHFDLSEQYVLELFFLEIKEFACIWVEEQQKYAYTGSFSPSIPGTSIFIGGLNTTGGVECPTLYSAYDSSKYAAQIMIPINFDGGGGTTTGSIEELDLSPFTLPQYDYLIGMTYQGVFFGMSEQININHTNYDGIKVWDQTNNVKMFFDPFVSGNTYILSVFFTAQSGYNFDSININNINPRPNAIKKGYYNSIAEEVEYSEENNAIQLMYCFYDTSISGYINSIDLSDLEVGYYDNKKVSDVITLINGLNLTNMTVIPESSDGPIACFENISGEPVELGVNDTFQDKERYRMSFVLKANDNYSFPYMTFDDYYIYAGSYDVGSEIAECNLIVDDYDGDSKNDVKVICEFTIGDIPASAYIKNINVKNVIPNDFSQYEDLKASDLISSANSWNFGELIRKGVICYKENNSSFTVMNSTESFVPGKNYKLELFLQAPEGKLFDSKYDEEANSYVYKGAILPQNLGTIAVGEIKGSGNNMYIDGSKDNDNYTNPKNGMKITISFNVGEVVDVVEISSWSQLASAINNSSASTLAFKLKNDITATDIDYTFFIPSNLYVKIDLNGHIINRNLVSPTGTMTGYNDFEFYRGSVFHVEGKLKITDSSPTTLHEGYIINNVWCIKRDNLDEPEKEIIRDHSIPKSIYGGIITGGIGYYYNWYNLTYGGGIYIDCTRTDTEVVMNGGTICGNISNNFGGGVAMNSNGDLSQDSDRAKLIMNGVTICNNYAVGSPSNGGWGGGIFSHNGFVTINDCHIDENVADERGGGIYNSDRSTLTITSGTVKNNAAKITGGIYSFGSYNDQLNLLATPGKEIVITGNKCEKKGNVYSFNTRISGKVIIKNNTSSEPARVCSYSGRLFYKEYPSGPYPTNGHIIGETPFFYDIVYLDGYYYPNDFLIDDADDGFGCNQKIYIEGDLTGSDINLTTAGFFDIDRTKEKFNEVKTEAIYNFATYNPNAKVGDYIHQVGPAIYHFELNKTNGSIYVVTTEVKKITDRDSFKEALEDAEEKYIESEDIKIKIELSDDVGDENDPFEDNGLYIPPNVELDLNGHDVFIGDSDDNGDGDTVVIYGDLTDSGEDKGRLFLDDPNKLIYNSVEDTDEDDGTRLEPVWNPPTEALGGYYCIYKIGANTKWDATADGDKWEEPGDDAGKFKVQPTAYLNLTDLLEDYGLVYGANTKVRAGLRLNLYRKNSNKASTYYFAFSEELTNSWASKKPKENCLYVPITGLAPYEKVEAQAAIFSKPNTTKVNIPQENARFFSKSNVAGSGN